MIVPSAPWDLWNSKSLSNGKVQITSLFKTKNGSPSDKCSLAKANGPAV